MQKLTWFTFVSVILFCSSCKNNDFIKGEEGLEYKIISSGSGEKVKYGQFLQLHIAQYVRKNNTDSLLQNTRNSIPYTEALDSITIPPAYFKILAGLRNNDSAVIRILTDSAFKKQTMPPIFQKGQFLLTTIKVVNIFKTKEEADVARKAANEKAELAIKAKQAEQLTKDDGILNDYFKKHNITPSKAPLGTYVEIINPGTGKFFFMGWYHKWPMVVGRLYHGKKWPLLLF